MELRTERLVLRPLTMDDAADVFEYSRNPVVGQNAGWKPHESLEETCEVMRTVFLDQPTVWGMELNGKIVGTIGLIDDPKRSLPEVKLLGYALGEPYWGQGLMTEAVRAVCRFGFEQMGLIAISATTYPENARSKRVLEKVGFQKEGHLQWVERSYLNELKDLDCYLLLPETGMFS